MTTLGERLRFGAIAAAWALLAYGTVLCIVEPETHSMTRALVHFVATAALTLWLLPRPTR